MYLSHGLGRDEVVKDSRRPLGEFPLRQVAVLLTGQPELEVLLTEL